MEQYFILHGLGQTPASWNRVVNRLHMENVICPDLFEGNEEIDYPTILKQLEKQFSFFENLNICGISLGAMLAIHYTIKHPRKVKSLILLAPQYRTPKILIGIQNLIFRCMPNGEFEKMGVKKKNVIKICHSMRRVNLQAELNSINCPVMIICGKKDRANKRSALEICSRIKQAEIVFIENAGHELNVEEPNKTADLIIGFWNEISKENDRQEKSII